MRLLFCFVACAANAVAQTNSFTIYSGCINGASRGTLNSQGGELLMQVPGSHFAGIGTDVNGTGTRLLGLRCSLQDQNATTPETYHLVVRGDAAGRPDCSAAGLLLRVGPLATPSAPTQPPWILTTTLATPSVVLPVCGSYYHGAEVAPAPQWPSDGLSFHISTYYQQPTLGQADNPAANAPNLAWTCINGVTAQPTTPRTVRFELLVESAVLNVGNVDLATAANNCVTQLGGRSFGVGGLWPACEGTTGRRHDGLDLRVRNQAHAGGVFVVFFGADLGCPGLTAPGLLRGALYVDPAVQVVVAGLDPGQGEGTATLLPPGAGVCAAMLRNLAHFQAATVGTTWSLPIHTSNRASTMYLP